MAKSSANNIQREIRYQQARRRLPEWQRLFQQPHQGLRAVAALLSALFAGIQAAARYH